MTLRLAWYMIHEYWCSLILTYRDLVWTNPMRITPDPSSKHGRIGCVLTLLSYDCQMFMGRASICCYRWTEWLREFVMSSFEYLQALMMLLFCRWQILFSAVFNWSSSENFNIQMSILLSILCSEIVGWCTRLYLVSFQLNFVVYDHKQFTLITALHHVVVLQITVFQVFKCLKGIQLHSFFIFSKSVNSFTLLER